MAEHRRIFELFDMDMDGTVSLEEVGAMLRVLARQLQVPPSPALARRARRWPVRAADVRPRGRVRRHPSLGAPARAKRPTAGCGTPPPTDPTRSLSHTHPCVARAAP